MTEQKQKILTEGKETKIRNCVFWFVVVYAAVLTGLYGQAQYRLVNTEAELANVKMEMANQQVLMLGDKATTSEVVEEVVEEETVEVAPVEEEPEVELAAE